MVSLSLIGKIAHAETLISNCILDYGVEKLVLSFNGGKDCTVLLHLIATVLCKFKLLDKVALKTIYVRENEPFGEVQDFIKKCEKRYPFIRLKEYPPGLKSAFQSVIDSSPDVCIFVGVRRTDPYCQSLKEVNYTDNGWPKFLRIHPLLDWTYADIWEYIDSYNVPYCILYSLGFTSIGSISKTVPNPKLLDANVPAFKHARQLSDAKFERDGRL